MNVIKILATAVAIGKKVFLGFEKGFGDEQKVGQVINSPMYQAAKRDLDVMGDIIVQAGITRQTLNAVRAGAMSGDDARIVAAANFTSYYKDYLALRGLEPADDAAFQAKLNDLIGDYNDLLNLCKPK